MHYSKSYLAALAWIALAASAYGATFGNVVQIGGHAADLALDHSRNRLYVSNFTANRIEVIDRATGNLETPIRVAAQPGAIALSPNQRWLVVAHVANFADPNTPMHSLTILDLAAQTRRTLAMGLPPLAVSFGSDGMALVVTTEDFRLLEPQSATVQTLITIENLATTAELPVEKGTFPPQVIKASSSASGNGSVIYGFAEAGGENQVMSFRYHVPTRSLGVIGLKSEPPLGPRTVSVDEEGLLYLEGWALQNPAGVLLAQFPNATGKFNIGGHVIDSRRGLIYAQVETAVENGNGGNGSNGPSNGTGNTGSQSNGTAAPPAEPVLEVLEWDNLTVREKLKLPENLAGKAVLTPDASVMYAISDSGVLVLPVGSLEQQHRVASVQEDVLFLGNFCDRSLATKEIRIVNPGGGSTPFTVSTQTPGVSVSSNSGQTPAVVRISVDPNVFQNRKGTVTAKLEIRSNAAINVIEPVRVLINTREPEQRGTVINVPGRLADMLADPARNRFYVVRQDKNQVLVFEATSFKQIGALRTGNTPTQLAMTLDGRYLIAGNDNSQIANVYDLETLEAGTPIVLPGGHYPRSIGVSSNAMLVASRVAGPKHTIDRVDFATRTAVELPTLGIYENDIDSKTVLARTPSGEKIFIAMADGNVMIYDAGSDAFAVSRKDFTELKGSYDAITDSMFLVGNHVLNRSLVPVARLDAENGDPSGFLSAGGFGLRTTTPATSSPGVIQRVNMQTSSGIRPVRMAEAPLTGTEQFPFTRTLAAFPNSSSLVSLSISGLTVLPWDYDVELAQPMIQRVVNSADYSEAVASGGLISIFGENLAAEQAAAQELPLPTTLGEACLTVNNRLVPVLFSSRGQINGQLPFDVSGAGTMILRTPGGTSQPFNFQVRPAAPAIFRSGTAGSRSGIATVVRARNNQLVTLSNPIHPEDVIVIFATGLGGTSPVVSAGEGAPANPLAQAATLPVVTLGGVALPIQFAGLAPGMVGVYQINAQVPYWVPTGMAIPLVIGQGGVTTTLEVRVVQ